MDFILLGMLLVWALVGWFVGSLAGRLATRQRERCGRWYSLIIDPKVRMRFAACWTLPAASC